MRIGETGGTTVLGLRRRGLPQILAGATGPRATGSLRAGPSFRGSWPAGPSLGQAAPRRVVVGFQPPPKLKARAPVPPRGVRNRERVAPRCSGGRGATTPGLQPRQPRKLEIQPADSG